MLSPDTPYYVALVALLISYLWVGHVIWTGVRAHLGNDPNAVVMAHQERQGHMAMLLPKFTVIAFWPLVACFAILANVLAALRPTAPHL